jgi:hypothetical protein
MAVRYSLNGDSFVAEKARVWIAKLGGAAIDLAPDGKRIAVVTPVEGPDGPKADHEVVLLEISPIISAGWRQPVNDRGNEKSR